MNEPLVEHWTPGSDDRLRGNVERVFFWYGKPDRPRERVFPNGHATIMLQLDAPYRPGEGANRHAFPSLCADGLWTSSFVVEAPPTRTRVVGISLTPAGAVRILDSSIAEISSATYALDDVVGRIGRELGERTESARTPKPAIEVVVRWLRDRVDRSRELPSDVAHVAAAIEAHHGVFPVRSFLETLTQSPSRLTGTFRAHFGMTPKRFARIVRFRHAVDLLVAERPIVEVAASAGFYDQAHFNAEFKLHAGMTPGAFLAADRYPGSASLAEGDWDVFSKTAEVSVL